jgi:hypothetical protein
MGQHKGPATPLPGFLRIVRTGGHWLGTPPSASQATNLCWPLGTCAWPGRCPVPGLGTGSSTSQCLGCGSGDRAVTQASEGRFPPKVKASALQVGSTSRPALLEESGNFWGSWLLRLGQRLSYRKEAREGHKSVLPWPESVSRWQLGPASVCAACAGTQGSPCRKALGLLLWSTVSILKSFMTS